jgi:glycerol-3-phosphate dehydrogenase subunit C
MGTLSTPFAPLVNATTGLKPVRRLLDARLKSTAARCRNMALAPFAALTASSRPARRSTRAGGVFHGCYVNYNHPQLGKDLIRVSTRWAPACSCYQEKCCGVPLIANGFFAKARKQAQSNVAAMRENAADHCHLIDLHLYAAR